MLVQRHQNQSPMLKEIAFFEKQMHWEGYSAACRPGSSPGSLGSLTLSFSPQSCAALFALLQKSADGWMRGAGFSTNGSTLALIKDPELSPLQLHRLLLLLLQHRPPHPHHRTCPLGSVGAPSPSEGEGASPSPPPHHCLGSGFYCSSRR